MLAQLNQFGRKKAVKSEKKMIKYLNDKVYEFIHSGGVQGESYKSAGTMEMSQDQTTKHAYADTFLPKVDPATQKVIIVTIVCSDQMKAKAPAFDQLVTQLIEIFDNLKQ